MIIVGATLSHAAKHFSELRAETMLSAPKVSEFAECGTRILRVIHGAERTWLNCTTQ